MTKELIAPQSRRAVLTAGLGAVAATVAGAFVRPSSVEAGADDNAIVYIGGTYADIELQTSLANRTDNGIVLWCESNIGPGSNPTEGAGTAIVGWSAYGIGVQGQSLTGVAVKAIGGGVGVDAAVSGEGASYGVKGSGPVAGVKADGGQYGVDASGSVYGVAANGGAGTGVSASGGVGVSAQGSSMGVSASGATGVVGRSNTDYTGVMGGSGLVGPQVQAKTGVYGYAIQDSSSRGVYGRSNAGTGVRGYATTGVGVSAQATTGYALRTDGRLRFDKSGGIATIAAGTSSIVVNPGIDLSTGTAVVATLQGSAGGTTNVLRVVVNATANTFEVFLTANTVGSVKVAWFAFG